jgi:lysophospholipase L1-like esterase
MCFRRNLRAGLFLVPFVASGVVAQRSDQHTPSQAAHRAGSTTINAVFIGDSITEGGYLPEDARPPAVAVAWLKQKLPNMNINMSNQGKSGHTTVDTLPVTATDFVVIERAANELIQANQGQLIFSVMLGTNDSAEIGTLGAPVSRDNYGRNLQTILDRLLGDYPGSKVVLHRPTWYSPTTYNGSRYLSQGLARLQSYFPVLRNLVAQYSVRQPGRVFLGDVRAYSAFERSKHDLLLPEQGNAGVFYLHPNAAGAQLLGEYWGEAIRLALR